MKNVNLYSIGALIACEDKFKLEIKLILRHILGLSAAQLITNNHQILSVDELEQFNILKARVFNNEPLNYITGFREFYSREFKVNSDTLIPRPETELLAEEVIKLAIPGSSILDLGTGSGCIAITAKLECPDALVTALDKYQNTLDVAIENATFLNATVEFIQSDWFSNISGRVFDLIVSNPPYIVSDDVHLDNLKFEPQHALTDFNDGLDCLKIIIAGAPSFLVKGGWLLVEHGHDQKITVQQLFESSGFININTIIDYSGLDRITIGQYS